MGGHDSEEGEDMKGCSFEVLLHHSGDVSPERARVNPSASALTHGHSLQGDATEEHGAS